MKNIMLSIALVSAAAFAVAATPEVDSAGLQGDAQSQGADLPVRVATEQPHGDAETHPAKAKLSGSGKVLEVIDSPKYTYLKVTGSKEPLWLAVFKADVTRGMTVKYYGGIAMRKFYSKSLDRTFDSIIFVESLELVMN